MASHAMCIIMREMKVNKIEKYIVDIYERKLCDFKIQAGEKWAIYGSGNGAEVVFEILKRWKLESVITAVIDNDKVALKKEELHGFAIKSLKDTYHDVDGIIIASMDYHEVVYERVKNELSSLHDARCRVINLFGHNTSDETLEYVNYIEEQYKYADRGAFKDFNEDELRITESDTKVIAWYLPQFHRIVSNDYYYGRGFTEWTNTSKTIPMYVGHYQPHIPYDVGYYDLNNPEVFERQIQLARHYGIYGFSFYYYWFSGKQIMEKPVKYFLSHPELDMNFCLTWANENWTALWDGGNHELIYEQNLQDDDDRGFIEDIIPFLSDGRYIRINGKSLLIVYRPNIWQKDRVRRLFDNFRDEMNKKGLGDLYIGLCNARGFDEDVNEWGADALIEFPPHGVGQRTPIIRVDGYMNPNFVGYIREARDYIYNKSYLSAHKSKMVFRGAMPSWDNTARKAYKGANVYKGLTPETFYIWLHDIMLESKSIHTEAENIVFVNAWNEWAEGCHLEPDMKYGYANLDAVKRAIMDSR